MLPYIAYMDPMGYIYIYIVLYMRYGQNKRRLRVTTLVREGPVVSRKCTKPCKAIGPPKSDNL